MQSAARIKNFKQAIIGCGYNSTHQNQFVEINLKKLPEELLTEIFSNNHVLKDKLQLLNENDIESRTQIKKHVIDLLPHMSDETFDLLAYVIITRAADIEYVVSYINEFKTRYVKLNGINRGVEYDSEYHLTETLLQIAVRNRCDNTVAFLIKNGANADSRMIGHYYTPIDLDSSEKTISLLIQAGANVSDLDYDDIFSINNVEKAEGLSHTQHIEILLKFGLDPNLVLKGLADGRHNYADQVFRNEELVKKLLPYLKNHTDYSAFGLISQIVYNIGSNHNSHLYSQNGIIDFFKTIRAQGYPFNNTNDYYGLLAAAKQGNKKLVKLFLINGVSPCHEYNLDRESEQLIKSVLAEIPYTEAEESKKWEILSKLATECLPTGLLSYVATFFSIEKNSERNVARDVLKGAINDVFEEKSRYSKKFISKVAGLHNMIFKQKVIFDSHDSSYMADNVHDSLRPKL